MSEALECLNDSDTVVQKTVIVMIGLPVFLEQCSNLSGNRKKLYFENASPLPKLEGDENKSLQCRRLSPNCPVICRS